MSVAAEAKRTGQSRWFEWLGRAGLAAKGVSYAIVGVLAIQVATGDRSQTEDRPGALRTLADEPLGRALIVGLAVGFAAYALWRLAQAILDRDDEGEDAKGLAKRAVNLGKAAIYGGLVISALSVLAGDSGSHNNEDRATAGVLEAPAGRYLVIAGGLVIGAVGAWNVYRALTAKFRKKLRTGAMEDAPETAATIFGVSGHLARGVVFGIAAWFLVKAAVQYDPNEAVGLDGALAKLAQQTYGPWLLGAVAAGLFAYGVFALFEARYRRV